MSGIESEENKGSKETEEGEREGVDERGGGGERDYNGKKTLVSSIKSEKTYVVPPEPVTLRLLKLGVS